MGISLTLKMTSGVDFSPFCKRLKMTNSINSRLYLKFCGYFANAQYDNVDFLLLLNMTSGADFLLWFALHNPLGRSFHSLKMTKVCRHCELVFQFLNFRSILPQNLRNHKKFKTSQRLFKKFKTSQRLFKKKQNFSKIIQKSKRKKDF